MILIANGFIVNVMISYLKGIIRHQVQSSDEVFTSDELNMLRLKISVLEYLIVTDSACVTDYKGGRVKQMQTLYYKQNPHDT